MRNVQVKRCLVGVLAADLWEWSSLSLLWFLIKRFNVQKESFILPEKVIVRDPQGNGYVIERVLGKGEFIELDYLPMRVALVAGLVKRIGG
jgi:hypothetical protein